MASRSAKKLDMNVESRNTSIQVGAAFSYTYTNASMDNGNANSNMYGFAIYGSWLHESGQYQRQIWLESTL